MKPKMIVVLFGALIMASLHSAQAQQPKIPRIGFVAGGSASAAAPRADAFKRGLRELGYVEGQNIAVEYRYAEGKLDRLPELIAELVRSKIDVIVSSTDQGLGAAQKATKTIPIVMMATGDPVAAGLVANLARPGGNITGTTTLSSETTRKRVELFKEAVPQLSQMAVLWNPGSLTQPQLLKEIEVTAKALDVKLQSLGLPRPEDLENAFSAMTKERPNGLFLFRSPIIRIHSGRITEFADKNRLPTMYEDSTFVEGGGLMSYGPDIAELDRRAMIYVDKILKGAKPGDLPVEAAKKFELIINLKTAQQIGLTIPQAVLSRADKLMK